MITFTEAKLKEFAPIAAQEFESFCPAFNKMMDFNESGPIASWAGHAALVHYRCLLDFLTRKERSSRNTDNDDVLAVDYVPDWFQLVTIKLWMREEMKRCNKMLAHLSYSRLVAMQGDDHYWNLNQLMRIKDYWNCFLEHMPADRRAWLTLSSGGL